MNRSPRFPVPAAFALALAALPVEAAPNDNESLAEIRALYAAIDRGEPISTRKIEFDVEGDPMQGTITCRRFPDGLSSIDLSYIAGDHGGSDQHFYYGPDGLFFIFEESSSWRFGPPTAAGQPTSIDTLVENRYYFRHGTCFHALTRRAESANAKALKDIVSKLPNEVFDPGKQAPLLFRRALALKGLATAEEAAAFFAAEWETP